VYQCEENSKGVEDTILLVVNTHLLFNNGRGDVKLAQVDLIMKSIEYLKLELEEKHPGFNVNTILCGDFNAIPNSGVYEFINKGNFEWLSRKKNEISGQKYAFIGKDYKHVFYNDGPITENIEKKHERFWRLNRNYEMGEETAGNNTPYWVSKIQSTKITGIETDEVDENSWVKILYSTIPDTEENLKKFKASDIAFKKLHNPATLMKGKYFYLVMQINLKWYFYLNYCNAFT